MKKFRNLLTGLVESDAAYGASLKKIAHDEKIKSLSKRDRETLMRIADMMKNANRDDIKHEETELNEGGDCYHCDGKDDDCKHCGGSGYVQFKDDDRDSRITSKDIKMAIGIANDPRYKDGNYSAAYSKISKLKKGLVSHPRVKDALRQANESVVEGDTGAFTNVKRIAKELQKESPNRYSPLQMAKAKKEREDRRKQSGDSERNRYQRLKQRAYGNYMGGLKDDFVHIEATLEENYRILATKGMGTETPSSANNIKKNGIEMDYYDASGSKRRGKISNIDNETYTVRDLDDGKYRKYKFLDREKAKEYLKKESINEASAKADAMKAIKRDRDFQQVKDVDVRATTADMKLAKKNPIVQLRKILDYKGGTMEFLNKKKLKLKSDEADALLRGFDSLQKVQDKEKYQLLISKDPASLKKILKIVKR